MEITEVRVGNVLTRTGGFLATVASHSLQPYRGCSFGRSLCGVGCYVQHSAWVTRGRTWGEFLEVRVNAAESYLAHAAAERRWARRARGSFDIFMSSATEPFLPQEERYGVTRSVLEAMLTVPPDALVVQTHSHRVGDHAALLCRLAHHTRLRVHVSIETDRDRIAGLPPPASPVSRRFEAARALRDAGLFTVITVSPLLPIADPERFFERAALCADAVVIDHFIQGDGSPAGTRTLATPLPAAIERVEPESVTLGYRDRMVQVAARFLPGRVGVNIDGFAGRFISAVPARLGPTPSGSVPSDTVVDASSGQGRVRSHAVHAAAAAGIGERSLRSRAVPDGRSRRSRAGGR
jgi:DNA repair photolyase